MSKAPVRVAVVYHCIAHYREPVFKELCNTDDNIEYTFFSGDADCVPSLKTMDKNKSTIPISEGGLRWSLVKNHWFNNKILWQEGVSVLGLNKNYDVIIYLGVVYHLSTWVSCILARLSGKRTYMWSHGFLRRESGLKGMVRSVFYRLADGMLLYHHRARDLLVQRGFSPNRLDVLYNSLNVKEQKCVRDKISDTDIKNLRQKLFSRPDLPVLLWVGRLTQQKKLEMIIDAASRLKGNDFEVNLLFVGDGPELDSLKHNVKLNDLTDNVCFYGATHNESELGPLIMASDICVAPGEVGLTCMHALVYGTPVITHDNPDYQMPEYEAIFPGKSGCFFKYGDIDDLASNVKAWFLNNQERSAVRESCYEVIDKHYNPWNQVRIINNMVLTGRSTLE